MGRDPYTRIPVVGVKHPYTNITLPLTFLPSKLNYAGPTRIVRRDCPSQPGAHSLKWATFLELEATASPARENIVGATMSWKDVYGRSFR